ncbi:MgtC/SapB family protein [Bacillus cereus]|nr:MgtC/SapB family protein [Bacillus cereus]MEB8667214.1 MgtC/SapB family protein [Bacillus cereus]
MSYEFLLKLGLALFLGLFIGIDRQLKNKPLGVKTSMVISVASCLITMVSIESVHVYSVPGHTNMDPMRLAAQIVSGIGFLGAGFYLQATVAMVLIILAINVLPQLVKIAGPYSLRQKDLSIKITVKEHHELDGIFKQIKNLGMHVKRVKIKDIDSGAFQQLEMVILAPEDLYTTELYSSLKEIDRVVSVEVESR